MHAELRTCSPSGVPVSLSAGHLNQKETTMFQMHPDEFESHIALRQEIVQQGIDAARHPGDLAGLRAMIGRVLIAAGERIRGRDLSTTASPIPRRVIQLAR